MTKKNHSTVEDPEDLIRALAAMQRAAESGDAKAMQRAWGEVWGHLGQHVMGSHEPSKAAVGELVKSGQVTAKRSQVGERHDGGDTKAGYRYVLGWGLERLRSESKRPQVMARRIVTELITRALPFGRGLDGIAEGLERAHQDVVGYPYGQPWYGLLVERLEKNAYHAEDDRMRVVKDDRERESWETVWRQGLSKGKGLLGKVARGEAPGWSATKVATGAEVLVDISRVHRAPPELTAEVIDGMLAQVGLSKGGRHGKRLARTLVADWWAGVQKSRKNGAK